MQVEAPLEAAPIETPPRRGPGRPRGARKAPPERLGRKHLTLPGKEHALLAKMAEDNVRPISYELLIAVRTHLRGAGLLD